MYKLLIGILLAGTVSIFAAGRGKQIRLSFLHLTVALSLGILNFASHHPRDKCRTVPDNSEACVRLEQFGGSSGGYWQIILDKRVAIKVYRYLRIEARSEPAAEIKLGFVTTAGAGRESFSTFLDLTKEWRIYYIPLTQNKYGRGGFRFTRCQGKSTNDVFRAGQLISVWITPWAPIKRIYYIRSITLTTKK